jgi:hypothetical protein
LDKLEDSTVLFRCRRTIATLRCQSRTNFSAEN